MPTFTRGATSIYYEEQGSGHPLLVFAPGGMRSAIELLARSPYHPVKELSGEFRVITMDQRNAGASRAPISAADGWLRCYWSSASQTAFSWVKFSIADSPCSRPKPDSPDPPQGRRTSVYP